MEAEHWAKSPHDYCFYYLGQTAILHSDCEKCAKMLLIVLFPIIINPSIKCMSFTVKLCSSDVTAWSNSALQTISLEW